MPALTHSAYRHTICPTHKGFVSNGFVFLWNFELWQRLQVGTRGLEWWHERYMDGSVCGCRWIELGKWRRMASYISGWLVIGDSAWCFLIASTHAHTRAHLIDITTGKHTYISFLSGLSLGSTVADPKSMSPQLFRVAIVCLLYFFLISTHTNIVDLCEFVMNWRFPLFSTSFLCCCLLSTPHCCCLFICWRIIFISVLMMANTVWHHYYWWWMIIAWQNSFQISIEY